MEDWVLLPGLCYLLHTESRLKLRHHSSPRLICDDFRNICSFPHSFTLGQGQGWQGQQCSCSGRQTGLAEIPKNLLHGKLSAAQQGSDASIFMAGDTMAPSTTTLYGAFPMGYLLHLRFLVATILLSKILDVSSKCNQLHSLSYWFFT